jgi:hypothetical protein
MVHGVNQRPFLFGRQLADIALMTGDGQSRQEKEGGQRPAVLLKTGITPIAQLGHKPRQLFSAIAPVSGAQLSNVVKPVKTRSYAKWNPCTGSFYRHISPRINSRTLMRGKRAQHGFFHRLRIAISEAMLHDSHFDKVCNH